MTRTGGNAFGEGGIGSNPETGTGHSKQGDYTSLYMVV